MLTYPVIETSNTFSPSGNVPGSYSPVDGKGVRHDTFETRTLDRRRSCHPRGHRGHRRVFGRRRQRRLLERNAGGGRRPPPALPQAVRLVRRPTTKTTAATTSRSQSTLLTRIPPPTAKMSNRIRRRSRSPDKVSP